MDIIEVADFITEDITIIITTITTGIWEKAE
jgi:hypothetical protein